ncbi:hypothetical protein ACWGOQ_0018250 [Aquimarina sp. M1]
MIRQFFLNKVTIICAMIFMMGCSTDSVTNDMVIEETALDKRRPILLADGTIEVLIEYVEGTSDSLKNEIRTEYRLLLLISDIVQCEEDDKETWTVESARIPGPLADTSSDEPLRQAIQNVTYFANCKPRN